MTKRQELIKQLLKEGKTYREIGAIMNISRQRVHQLLTGYVSPYHSRRYKKASKTLAQRAA